MMEKIQQFIHGFGDRPYFIISHRNLIVWMMIWAAFVMVGIRIGMDGRIDKSPIVRGERFSIGETIYQCKSVYDNSMPGLK